MGLCYDSESLQARRTRPPQSEVGDAGDPFGLDDMGNKQKDEWDSKDWTEKLTPCKFSACKTDSYTLDPVEKIKDPSSDIFIR